MAASLTALAAMACMRIAPPSAFTPPPEPRFTDAPPASQIAAFGADMDDDARIEALQARLTAVELEIVNLRKALDVLGPLPEHEDLFIPVAMAEVDAPSGEVSLSLFKQGGLGYFATATAAADIGDTSGLGYDGLDRGMTIAALSEDAALKALCTELSAIAGPCRPAAPIRAW